MVCGVMQTTLTSLEQNESAGREDDIAACTLREVRCEVVEHLCLPWLVDTDAHYLVRS